MDPQFSISRDYPVSAQVLWADLIDFSALAASMMGELSYEGIPEGPVTEGQKIDVKLKRWGWLPIGGWHIDVALRDDENLIMETHERGGPVKSYHHRMEVISLDRKTCRYTDYLHIDAGWITPLLLPTFKSMYERRHGKRRARLVGLAN